MSRICYAGTDTEVELGDHVSYRSQLLWWRWKLGRVSYLPGVSKRHAEMEHNGLKWVGVSGIDGTFRGILIEPGTESLQPSVRFSARSDGSSYLSPHDIPKHQW